MDNQFSLHFPHTPGFKREGTSREAAEKMAPRAATLRHRILMVLASGPRTADETASLLNESVLAVRPRFTELQELGEIEDTGTRRLNQSGRSAMVWRLK